MLKLSMKSRVMQKLAKKLSKIYLLKIAQQLPLIKYLHRRVKLSRKKWKLNETNEKIIFYRILFSCNIVYAIVSCLINIPFKLREVNVV